jgi:nucleotide-binding universal stress UspA family protein
MPIRPTQTRVLVPLTSAGAAEEKLPVVQQQAHAFDAQVVLLHVIEGAPATPVAARDELELEAHAFLDDVAARLQREGLGVYTDVRHGVVTKEVCDAAREHGASLIILGASHRRAWPRRLLADPAPANSIAREAPCPVMVVPRTDSMRFDLAAA